jgi:hypothetical protein
MDAQATQAAMRALRSELASQVMPALPRQEHSDLGLHGIPHIVLDDFLISCSVSLLAYDHFCCTSVSACMLGGQGVGWAPAAESYEG